MSRDPRVVDVTRVTGCAYSVALAEIRRRAVDGSIGDYLIAVRSLLQSDRHGGVNAERCVRCLKLRHGGGCRP